MGILLVWCILNFAEGGCGKHQLYGIQISCMNIYFENNNNNNRCFVWWFVFFRLGWSMWTEGQLLFFHSNIIDLYKIFKKKNSGICWLYDKRYNERIVIFLSLIWMNSLVYDIHLEITTFYCVFVVEIKGHRKYISI